MESLNVNGKKKLTTMINLSIFTNLADSFANLSYPSPNKSPRNFQNTSGSVVGLSIVAAMSRLTDSEEENYYSISRPVHIVISPSAANYNYNYNYMNQKKKPAAGVVDITDLDDDEHQAEELSESYTCVISHLGNDLVQKRVFFDDDDDDDDEDDDDDDDEDDDDDDDDASSPPVKLGFEFNRDFWSRDYFLSSCFLCNKNLHGLDIFMYRGEKAFCSIECRDKQIRSDDVKDNCGSEARKQLDYSVSPCSGPPPLPPPISAGVAVA